MIELAAVQAAFPDVQHLQPLSQESGQKEVLRGEVDGRTVVLKLIRPRETQRIMREIEAVAKLGCDYVPPTLEFGEREIGGVPVFFIIEAFIEGQTYRQILEAVGTPPLNQVLNVGEALLRACSDFEAHDLVHRDIKPENMIVDLDGKLWIIDFGIVRFLGMDSLTPTAARFGPSTIGYGAPEQMRNLKTRIDSRTDLFPVGVILYESLVGYHPHFDGQRDQIQVMNHMMNTDLPVLSIDGDVEGGLSEFVAALCSRFQSRRPQSAAQALEWFKAVRQRLERR